MQLKPDKGEYQGSCNRTCCQKPGATEYNTSTLKYYCFECAQLINSHADFDLLVPITNSNHPYYWMKRDRDAVAAGLPL